MLILESAASGSFIDDLAQDSDDPNSAIPIVITSTGYGPSYTKPPSDPNTSIPISFISLFTDAFEENYVLEDYLSTLKESFIQARERLYHVGHPFLDQAPQMYLPQGPITLTLTPVDPIIASISSDSLTITQKEPLALTAIAQYPGGGRLALNPVYLRFLSSNSLVFNPQDPNQFEIKDDQILITPAKNGLTTLIAYPAPQVYPDILLTARLPMEVSITGNSAAGGNKAVIVAGYQRNKIGEGPDTLWEETNTIANRAYQILRNKGYGREDIFYLSPYFLQDVDYNHRSDDDVDGHPSLPNLDLAFEKIKETGAQELLIFLVDHGDHEIFMLNPCCEENLTAQNLAHKIGDLVQGNMVSGKITILIEACYSGTFLKPIQEEMQQYSDPNQVIIITSVAEDESSYSIKGDGLLSFSYLFFDQFSQTNSFKSAFDYACFTIPPSDNQNPHLYTEEQAQERDYTLAYYVDEARPAITEREFSREGGRLELEAEVYALAGINRVWALIVSSEQAPQEMEGGLETNDYTIELIPDDPNVSYGGYYRVEVDDPYPDAFNYQIILSAQDTSGKVTTERTTICRQEKNKTGVIILVTDYWGIDGMGAKLFEDQGDFAYRILKEKGIHDDDIYYRKSPDIETIKEEIPLWLGGKNYDYLFIYLLGHGKKDSSEKVCFLLNQAESLFPDEILNYLTPREDCQVVFLCDIPYAEDFLKHIPVTLPWIGIASTDRYQNNWILKSDGTRYAPFSSLFFSALPYSSTIGEAYLHIWDAVCYLEKNPSVMDPYSFFGKEKIRQRLGFNLGNPPLIELSPPLIQSAQAWEEGSIIKVNLKIKETLEDISPWVVFYAPMGGTLTAALIQDPDDPTLWSCSQPKNQPYTKVLVFIQRDQDGNQAETLEWRERSISCSLPDLQLSVEDGYEPDETLKEANAIIVNTPAQSHTFHSQTDPDWVYFFGVAGYDYKIETEDISLCDSFIQLSLCDANGVVLKQSHASRPLSWRCSQDGYYYFKAMLESEYLPQGISYNLLVEDNQAGTPTVTIFGRVIYQGKGVNGVKVNLLSSGKLVKSPSYTRRLNNVSDNILLIDGWYFISGIITGNSYELMITEDDQDIILKQGITIDLPQAHQTHRIDDIILDADLKKKEGLSEFDPVYFYTISILEQGWAEQNYPPQGDKDCDGRTNLEEFINGTDINIPDYSQEEYFLKPGLNLFPFSLSDHDGDPHSSALFYSGYLKEGDSLWRYNQENHEWEWLSLSNGEWKGTNFPLENGKGCLIYKHPSQFFPQVISQPQNITVTPLVPGLNLVNIFPIPEVPEGYTSFQFLKESDSKEIQSISRYNPEKGEWEPSSLLFGRPTGVDFPILPAEAYLIMLKGD